MAKENDKTPVYKKWWFWVIIVVAILAIGGAVANNGKDNPIEQADSETKVIQDTPDDKLQDLKVGDSVTIKGVTVTVNSISDGKAALGGTAPTYEVNVTYKNQSGKLLSITPYDWTTVLHSGSDKAHVGGDTSFNLDNIDNGQEWTGNVTLWADDDAEKVKFESSSLNLSGDKKQATWMIKKD